jgi:hypothetical protein
MKLIFLKKNQVSSGEFYKPELIFQIYNSLNDRLELNKIT